VPEDIPLGSYLVSADVDAHGGLGQVAWSRNPAKAKSFASTAEAFEFWRSQSTVRPLREDGKPNRPMTAFSVQIEEAAYYA
jgi:hypothetical protein